MTRAATLVCILFFLPLLLGAQPSRPVLERIVTVDYQQKRCDDILHDLEIKTGCVFTYNYTLVDPNKIFSFRLTSVSLRRVLDHMFSGSLTYSVRNEYVIFHAAPAPLLEAAEPPKKTSYLISGYCLDSRNGSPVARVSIYDTVHLLATITDVYGHYELSYPAGTKSVEIRASRSLYSDTTIRIVPSTNRNVDITLAALPISSFASHDSLQLLPPSAYEDRHRVERFPWIDSLLSFEQRIQAANIRRYIPHGSQFSLVPFISTSGSLSGSVVNKFSFNLLGGYSGGVNGVELGSILNIDRGDVRWLQVSGFGNVVGGTTTGLQFAGSFNLNLGNVQGIQAAGAANIILDTLDGAQLAGTINIIHGAIHGVQIAGAVNLVTRDMDGVQIAGAVNSTFGHVSKAQLAGVLNHAHDVEGAQISGLLNISEKRTSGIQVSGFMNISGRTTGEQVAGFLNIAQDTMVGAQISGFLNVAHHFSGTQIGVINVADSCGKGIVVGLFSFVKKGYHQLEISSNEALFTSVAFRTGIPKFYNIITAGKDFSGTAWSFGYGIGHEFLFRPEFGLNLEITLNHLNPEKLATYRSDWYKMPVTFTWKPAKRFALAAGPVLNGYHSKVLIDPSDPHTLPVIPAMPGPMLIRNNNFKMWLGATVALRFF